jgi:hypothetical protein
MQQPWHPVVGSHTHVPAEHAVPAPHAVPQLPQLFGSFCSSTHAPLQELCPAGHVHCGLAGSHVWPPAQAVTCQLPFALHVSLLVLLAHWVTPGAQTPTHALPTHA